VLNCPSNPAGHRTVIRSGTLADLAQEILGEPHGDRFAELGLTANRWPLGRLVVRVRVVGVLLFGRLTVTDGRKGAWEVVVGGRGERLPGGNVGVRGGSVTRFDA